MITCNSNYNKYDNVQNFSYNIIAKLFENENIWKLLKYDTPDALTQANLTHAEKADLIWKGQLEQDEGGNYLIDTNQYRVFKQPSVDDSFNTMSTQLRVYKDMIYPTNRTVGYVIMVIELLVHNKLNGLSDITTERLSALEHEVIDTLNGSEIGGLGVLSLNKDAYTATGSKLVVNNNKNYFGIFIHFGTQVGA